MAIYHRNVTLIEVASPNRGASTNVSKRHVLQRYVPPTFPREAPTHPDRPAGAAAITLARYTHLMPDALEFARKQMDEWIVAQIQGN
jgi:hypothetical protein